MHPLAIISVVASVVASSAPTAAIDGLPRAPAAGHEGLSTERPRTLSPTGAPASPKTAAVWHALAAEAPAPAVARQVLAYLPYWEMGYQIRHWELLTILAWFAVSIDADGDPVQLHGWGDQATSALVAEAHAHGTLAILTVTNFDSASIRTLVTSASRRAHAIETCLGLMAAAGADGVNIDFETVPADARDGFTTFMGELTAAVREAAPGGGPGHVSLAGPSVDWGGAYDYDQLLAATDGIMVMAYGYHWKGGDPGPVSPLFGGDPWGPHSIAWTVDDYLTWGGLENRHKVMIGLPFYGREWPVASTAVPGKALGPGEAVTFDVARAEAATFGASWDAVTHTPYYHADRDGQLWQVWYEDRQAFADKVAYVDEMDLGGIGIWALGYDGPYDDYWDGIAEALVAAPALAEADPAAAERDVAERDVAERDAVEPFVEDSRAPDAGGSSELTVAETRPRGSGPRPSHDPAIAWSRRHDVRHASSCDATGQGAASAVPALLALLAMATRVRRRRG